MMQTCSTLDPKRRRSFVAQLSAQLDRKHGLKKACQSLGFGWRYLMKYSGLKRKGIKSYHKVNEQALQDRHNFTYFILMNYMYVFNSLPL